MHFSVAILLAVVASTAAAAAPMPINTAFSLTGIKRAQSTTVVVANVPDATTTVPVTAVEIPASTVAALPGASNTDAAGTAIAIARLFERKGKAAAGGAANNANANTGAGPTPNGQTPAPRPGANNAAAGAAANANPKGQTAGNTAANANGAAAAGGNGVPNNANNNNNANGNGAAARIPPNAARPPRALRFARDGIEKRRLQFED